MSAAVPESVTIPAVPGQVREARAFVFPVKSTWCAMRRC